MVQLRRFAVTCVGVLGPFALHPSRLLHPAPWLLFTAAVLMQLTLPQDTASQTSKADRGSAVMILVVGNLVVLVPVLEFVLREVERPAAWSWWVGLGGAMTWGGTLFRVWAIRSLGAAFTGLVQTTAEQALINRGPYQVLRHPSYTGAVIAFLGEAVLMQSLAGAVLTLFALVPVYLYRIRHEEIALRAHFGARYDGYAKSTWALLPFVY